MARYIEATETDDERVRAAIMDEILAYNREDLEATWAVLEWLRRLEGISRRPARDTSEPIISTETPRTALEAPTSGSSSARRFRTRYARTAFRG